ncbi:hypothetical protein LPJ61_002886, partial [Coemansia biformis]
AAPDDGVVVHGALGRPGAVDVLWFGGAQDAPSAEPQPGTADDNRPSAGFGVSCSSSGDDSDSGGECLLPAQLVDLYMRAIGGDAWAPYLLAAEDVDDKAGVGASDGAGEEADSGKGAVQGVLAGCEPNIIRTPDDMYTPRWIRGIGKGKEGLCPVCFDSGALIWRRMKCSAYWYHLNYFHGVSALTGRPFPAPLGLCGVCGEWVFTDSSRKVAINVPEIYWWKHIQACTKRAWHGDDA